MVIGQEYSAGGVAVPDILGVKVRVSVDVGVAAGVEVRFDSIEWVASVVEAQRGFVLTIGLREYFT